jgi:hypothetical protein
MGTVCPSALLRSLVDLNVGDDKVRIIEALGVGVGLCVAEKTKEELGRLLGPTSAGNPELFSLGASSSRSSISPHRNSLPVTLNVLQVSNSPRKLHAVDGLGGLASVLEGNTEERPAGFCGLRRIIRNSGVSDHLC